MNDYKLMADSYRKLLNQRKIDKETAEKEIRIYDFLSTCDSDDICRMVNSSAFNDIIKAYCKQALNDAEVEEKTVDAVMSQFYHLCDTVSAKEVLGMEKF